MSTSDAEPQGSTVAARTSTPWAQRFVGLGAVLLALGVVSIFVTSSYLQAAPSEVMDFHVADGWCIPGTESIGQHCFGDFSIVDDYFGGDGDAWNAGGAVAPSNYPAIAWYPALAAVHLGHLLGGGRAALLLYLGLSTACLLAPAIWVGWRRWSSRGAIALALIGLGSAPFLVTLDRGNSVALTVPPLLAFAVSFARRRYGWATVALICAALLKPQLAVLAVLLLAHRRYRDVAVAALGTATVTVLGFLPFPHFPQNILGWLRALTSYSSIQSASAPYPVNLGLGRSLVNGLDLVGIGQGMGATARAHLASWLDAHGSTLNFTVLAVGAVVLLLFSRGAPHLWSLTLALLMVTFASSTVYLYYISMFVVPTALLLRSPVESEAGRSAPWHGSLDETTDGGRVHRLVAWTLVAVLALLMAPIAIPPRVLGNRLMSFWSLDGASGAYQVLLGPALVVLLVVILVGMVHESLSRRRRAGRADIAERSADPPPESGPAVDGKGARAPEVVTPAGG